MAAGLIRDINLGNSFDIGVAQADKIHVKVDGTSIVRDPATGVLSSPVAAGGLLVVSGYINVNADGTTAAASPGVSATRTATGLWDVVPPANVVAASITLFEAENVRDSVSAHFTDFTFTRIWIGEGDNGATANVLRNRDLSITFLSPS